MVFFALSKKREILYVLQRDFFEVTLLTTRQAYLYI